MDKRVRNRIVLLVEDSDDDAFFFERALANAAGEAVLQRFPDGGAAINYLAQLSTNSPDLSSYVVFLDLKLPVLSGFEVLKWIRERGLSLEVIILSGSDLDSDVDAARELGASRFIVKPISSVQLRERLDDVVAGAVAGATQGA